MFVFTLPVQTSKIIKYLESHYKSIFTYNLKHFIVRVWPSRRIIIAV